MAVQLGRATVDEPKVDPCRARFLFRLQPGGKTFTIEAHNASFANRYIQSATFNGKPLNQWWIRQKDVLKGGHLVLELGPTANKDWARGMKLN